MILKLMTTIKKMCYFKTYGRYGTVVVSIYFSVSTN